MTSSSMTFDPTDFSAVADQSEVTDRDAYVDGTSRLQAAVVDAGLSELSSSEAKGRWAQARCDILATIKRANGYPDWGFASDIAKNIVRTIEANAFASIEGMTEQAAKRVVDAVKQQVTKYRRPTVIRYVVWNEPDFSKEKEKLFPNGVLDEDCLAKWNAKPPIKLRRRVEEHYKNAKGLTSLAWPDSNDTGGTGSAGDQGAASIKTKIAAVVKASEGGAGGIVPALAFSAAHESVKALTRGILPGGEIADRDAMIEECDVFESHLLLLGKFLRGEQSAAEFAKLSALAEAKPTTDEPSDDDDDEPSDDDDAKTADAEAVALAAASK